MVNENRNLTGWLDWNGFIEKAEIARRSTFEISICSQPLVGLDISHCKLTISQAHKLFATVLDKVSGGKAKASQVRTISLKERLRDWTTSGIVYGICTLVALAICTAVFPFYYESRWRLRGAHDDAFRIPADDWSYPFASGVTVLSCGEIRRDISSRDFPRAFEQDLSLLPVVN